jgi:hypothetical protein
MRSRCLHSSPRIRGKNVYVVLEGLVVLGKVENHGVFEEGEHGIEKLAMTPLAAKAIMANLLAEDHTSMS